MCSQHVSEVFPLPPNISGMNPGMFLGLRNSSGSCNYPVFIDPEVSRIIFEILKILRFMADDVVHEVTVLDQNCAELSVSVSLTTPPRAGSEES